VEKSTTLQHSNSRNLFHIIIVKLTAAEPQLTLSLITDVSMCFMVWLLFQLPSTGTQILVTA